MSDEVPSRDFPNRMDRVVRAVEREDRRRKRLIRIYTSLLIVPLGIGVFALVLGRTQGEEIERTAAEVMEPRLARVDSAYESISPALEDVRRVATDVEDLRDTLIEQGVEVRAEREELRAEREELRAEWEEFRADRAALMRLRAMVRDTLIPQLDDQQAELRELRREVERGRLQPQGFEDLRRRIEQIEATTGGLQRETRDLSERIRLIQERRLDSPP